MTDVNKDLYVLLDDQATQRQLYFTQPKEILIHRLGDPVEDLFAAIERAQGRRDWIAGLFHYEFAAALEPKLAGLAEAGDEVVRLGVFGPPSDHPPVEMLYRADPPEVSLSPCWMESDYKSRFERVQTYLRAGDAYQINLTFPMQDQTRSDAAHLYAGFRRRQPGRYGAILSLGGEEIISFSPELFFERQGRDMRMRPMKGTRSKQADDDMTEDAKSRAENLMIVDLLRNDLSRLCEPGSVKVPELFSIEDYPTLIQMTSQVTGRLRSEVQWRDILTALFPCGSVTGAPKIRAMEIIHELESGKRGPYCGAIGFIAPDDRASFSVAIRTATLKDGALRYDVGSGVVLDSDGADEYAECLLKATLFDTPEDAVIETVRSEPDGFVPNLVFHAGRLARARPGTDLSDILKQVDPLDEPARVRVSVTKSGLVETQVTPFLPLEEPIKLSISRYPLSATVQKTDEKTTHRDFYDGERLRVARLTGADEVVFFDAQGALKEGSFTSLFLEKEGVLLTPEGPGLLPGVLREAMVKEGRATIAHLTMADLLEADALFVGNSLRGLQRATLLSPELI